MLIDACESSTNIAYANSGITTVLNIVGMVEVDMPGEMRGTGETGVADYVAQNTDMGLLREIRLNLVVRTRGEDVRKERL